jgi:PilZ domain
MSRLGTPRAQRRRAIGRYPGEMPTAAPQIVEGQSARLDVGTSLPCRIIGFNHANVVLALGEQPEELEIGDPGYLLLETAGRVHALRGRIAAPPGDEVVLELTDGIRLGQRRSFSRAPLALPAKLRLPGGDLATVTRDISAGGVGVARDGADVPDGRFELVIQVAHHEVVATVTAVRLTATDLGLRFEEVSREDRLLLASLALAYHRGA